MARRRLREDIVTGLSTILGSLARFFRLGQSGAIQPGEEAEAGRTRLRTPEEIVAELSTRHQLPTVYLGARRSSSYIAEWYDTATGHRIGASRIQIEASPDTPRSTIDSRVRREARLRLPRYVSAELIDQSRVTMRIRTIGFVDLPPQQ